MAAHQITCSDSTLLNGASFRFNGIEVSGFKNTIDLRIALDFIDSLDRANLCHFIEEVSIDDYRIFIELRRFWLNKKCIDKNIIMLVIKNNLSDSIKFENISIIDDMLAL